VGPFGLGDGAFDNNVIDLSVIISRLPLVIEIGVGAFGDYKNCVVGGKAVGLLWRLACLEWRWLDSGLCCWFVLVGIG
jgi:hypothetical protein